MIKQVKQTVAKHMKHTGHARWFRAFVALVFLASTAIPAFMWMDGMKAYAISPEAEQVIGSANKNLSAKFSFDQQGNKWQFNKNGAAALAANIARQQGTDDVEGVAGALSQLTAKQVGGAGEKDTSLYSVDLPVKARDGITYYDNVNKLSFKMVPDFDARDGKLVQDRIVYPFGDGAQVVYTAKSNGMKEDIVLSKYIADTLRYSYDLELPDTLAAKLLDDGSIGIYSANVALFGSISFSGDEDKARVMDARKNGTKDNLVFSIPPPFIKDQTGNAGRTKYLLNDNRVTVVADQLKNLKYPLTVDPSVTVTSTSDFETDGNGESNLEYGTGEVRRGSISGGSLGTWASQTASPGCDKNVSGQNNGYIYCIDGTTIRYAKLSTTGTITASWQTGTALAQAYADRAGFIYNGYLYVTGGTFTTTARPDTYYIKLNSDGTMAASWQTGTTLNTSRYFHTALAYNGYAYVIAGALNGTTRTASIEYAAINANGSLSAWTATTNAPTVRWEHTAAIYNGNLYVFGGQSNSSALTDARYIPINSDGTLGSAWTLATTIPGFSNRRATAIAYKGYMYLVGGFNNAGVVCASDVRYAMIRANGSLGDWAVATSPGVGAGQVCYPSVAQYHDYLVMYGGQNNASAKQTGVFSVQANAAGAVEASITTTSYDTAANGRSDPAVATAYGYIYVMGGQVEGTGAGTNTVRYAPITADGSITAATWATASPFVEPRFGATIAVYGQYLYLIGGVNNSGGTTNCPVVGAGGQYCKNIEWAIINPSTGALTWQGSTFTYSSQGRAKLASAINNGYLYVLGGVYANNSTESTEVNYAQINPTTGALGAFAQTTAPLQTARGHVGAAAMNGKIYIVGGRVAKTNEVATPGSGGDITSWSFTGGSRSGGGEQAFSVTESKGVFYLTGGFTPGPNVTNAVQTIRINTDGSMGNWNTSTITMNGVRHDHGTAVYNDNLYIISGDVSNLLPNVVEDVWYHRINNGGSGSTDTWTAPVGDDLPAGRSQQYSFVYNDRAYAIGGIDNSGNNYSGAQHGFFATFDKTTGSKLTGWTSTANAPGTVIGNQNYVHHNGYVYQLGGRATSNATSVTSVNFTQINAGGTFGTWQSTSPLNTGRSESSVVASGNYIYIFGGCAASSRSTLDGICSSWLNTVEVGTINPATGQITGWSLLGAGNNFTAARSGHQTVAYNGYVYLMGGCTSFPGLSSVCDGLRSDVQVAKLNGSSLDANAGCGAVWCAGSRFAAARREFIAEAYNGYLYIATGYEPSLAAVQRAPIHSGGSIGMWETTATSLTAARKQASSFVYGGRLYVVAGNDGPGAGSTRTDVQRAVLNLTPRVGMYSKLITISPTTDIASVYYNGSFGSGSSVNYKIAPASGVFGSTMTAAQGTGSEPTPLCGLGTIYYVQITTSFDDSTRSTFPDANIGNATDFTVYYRLNATPSPNLRMTGGKWFYNEMQRELDTCKGIAS